MVRIDVINTLILMHICLVDCVGIDSFCELVIVVSVRLFLVLFPLPFVDLAIGQISFCTYRIDQLSIPVFVGGIIMIKFYYLPFLFTATKYLSWLFFMTECS
jgi:hypothetical protein